MLAALAGCGESRPPQMEAEKVEPKIFPDYSGVTIPAQIAPMNFNVEEPDAQQVYVKVTGSKGGDGSVGHLGRLRRR